MRLKSGQLNCRIYLFQKASYQGKLLPPISVEERKLTLLEYLRGLEFPLASACWGEGYCKRCVASTYLASQSKEKVTLLTCQYTIEEFLAKAHLFSYPFLGHPQGTFLWTAKIEISYL